MLPFSVTLNDHEPRIQGHIIYFDVEISQNFQRHGALHGLSACCYDPLVCVPLHLMNCLFPYPTLNLRNYCCRAREVTRSFMDMLLTQ